MRVREIYSCAQILPLTFSFLFSFLLLFSVFVKRRIKREERSLASLAIWASSSPVPPVAQGPAGLCLTNPSEPRSHRSPSAARRPSLDLLLLSISLWCPTTSLPRRRDPLLLRISLSVSPSLEPSRLLPPPARRPSWAPAPAWLRLSATVLHGCCRQASGLLHLPRPPLLGQAVPPRRPASSSRLWPHPRPPAA